MLQNVKIIHIGETREFTKKATGGEFAVTEMVFEWEVERPGYPNLKQSIVASASGWLNKELAEDYQKNGHPLSVSFSFSHRSWPDKDGKTRWFSDIRAGLPKEFFLEAKPF